MDREVYDILMSLLESMRSYAGRNGNLLDALDQAEDAIKEEWEESKDEDTDTE